MKRYRLGFLMGIVWIALMPNLLAQPPDPNPPDPHANYRAYPFGKDEKVIDIGIQPLWLPSGIIIEAMRRDSLLREALRQREITVRFHPFLKGSDVNVYLHDGKLEGGFGGDMPAIAACVADQVQVVSLAALNFTAIVAPKPLLLNNLRGHRIGYAPGSNAHYALLNALKIYRLSESDITLVPMDVNAMPLALERGQIDAFSAWEPTPAIAAKLYGHTVVHRSFSSGYFYFARLFAERHADLMSLLVAAEIRALNWLTRDEHLSQAIDWSQQAIRNLVGHDFELSHDEIMQLIRREIHKLSSMPMIPMKDLREDGHIGRATRFLGSLGKLPSALPWETVRECFHREVGEALLTESIANRLNTFAYEENPE